MAATLHECAVFFGHHRHNDVTRRHLHLLRQHNPFPIVPVHFSGEEHLDGSLDVGPVKQPWHSADIMLWEGFRRRTFNAQRYILLDWDCYCSMPLKKWYAEVWDADVSAPVVMTHPQNPWYWFHQIPHLPGLLRAHATGLVPLNGIMFSHKAMEAVTSFPLPDTFSELRAGTLAAAMGFIPQSWPLEKRGFNSAKGLKKVESDAPAFLHPVKR